MIQGSAHIEQARDSVYMELPATAGLAKQPPHHAISATAELINQTSRHNLETNCYFLTIRTFQATPLLEETTLNRVKFKSTSQHALPRALASHRHQHMASAVQQYSIPPLLRLLYSSTTMSKRCPCPLQRDRLITLHVRCNESPRLQCTATAASRDIKPPAAQTAPSTQGEKGYYYVLAHGDQGSSVWVT
jgi:hypothetical protein